MLFQQLIAHLSDCHAISLLIAPENDLLTITVNPMPKATSTNPALKKSFCLTGTAAELDQSFVQHFVDWAIKRKSLQEQLQEQLTDLDDAKKAAVSKIAKGGAKASSTPSAPAATTLESLVGGDDEDEDETGLGEPLPTSASGMESAAPAQADASGAVDLGSLL